MKMPLELNHKYKLVYLDYNADGEKIAFGVLQSNTDDFIVIAYKDKDRVIKKLGIKTSCVQSFLDLTHQLTDADNDLFVNDAEVTR